MLPARTSLPFLERALEAEGISYRAETSSLVYATREVRDLLMALRAIDDPSDELSLVSALRSPLFGCGDDDLFEFHVEHKGKWNVRSLPPDTLPADHPVVDALRALRELHHARMWVTPSELLERVVRERHLLELGADSGKFRDVSRRIRFVVDQARAFGDAAGGSLRDYLAWATLQGTEGARVVETVLPETDDDAVRIMTVHGAKGLQFPIVVCSGLTTKPQPSSVGVQVLLPHVDGYPEVRLAKRAHTDAFELHQAFDEQMSFHEKLRLLYVACTRAGSPRSSPSITRPTTPTPHDVEHDQRRVVERCGARRRRRRWTEPGRRRAQRHAGIGLAATGSRHVDCGARGRVRDGRAPPVRVGNRAGRVHRRRGRARSGGGEGGARSRAAPRGTKVATAPRSGGRCTRCSRPSTSRRVPDWRIWPPRRRPPKV